MSQFLTACAFHGHVCVGESETEGEEPCLDCAITHPQVFPRRNPQLFDKFRGDAKARQALYAIVERQQQVQIGSYPCVSRLSRFQHAEPLWWLKGVVDARLKETPKQFYDCASVDDWRLLCGDCVAAVRKHMPDTLRGEPFTSEGRYMFKCTMSQRIPEHFTDLIEIWENRALQDRGGRCRRTDMENMICEPCYNHYRANYLKKIVIEKYFDGDLMWKGGVEAS